MKKIFIFDNCKVIVNLPEDEEFQERLRKSSERFMRKVFANETERLQNRNAERKMLNGNSYTTGNFREEQILHR